MRKMVAVSALGLAVLVLALLVSMVIIESPKDTSPPASAMRGPSDTTFASPKLMAPSAFRLNWLSPVIVVPSSPKLISPVPTGSVPAVRVRVVSPPELRAKSTTLSSVGLFPWVPRSKTISPALSRVKSVKFSVSKNASPMMVSTVKLWGLVTEVGALSPSTIVTVVGSSKKEPASPEVAPRSMSPRRFRPSPLTSMKPPSPVSPPAAARTEPS